MWLSHLSAVDSNYFHVYYPGLLKATCLSMKERKVKDVDKNYSFFLLFLQYMYFKAA